MDQPQLRALDEVFCLAELAINRPAPGYPMYPDGERFWNLALQSGWHLAPTCGADNGGWPPVEALLAAKLG